MGLQCVTTMVSTGQYSHTNIIHPPPEDQWATSYTGTSGNQGCGQSFMVGGSYAGIVWGGCPSKPLPSMESGQEIPQLALETSEEGSSPIALSVLETATKPVL